MTRRLAAALGPEGELISHEADDELRGALAGLPFFAEAAHRLSPQPSPNEVDLGRADVTVLDSDFDRRAAESSSGGAARGPARSCSCTTPGTGTRRAHRRCGSASWSRRSASPVSGCGNPRGGFLGIKPGARAAAAGEAPLAPTGRTMRCVTLGREPSERPTRSRAR